MAPAPVGTPPMLSPAEYNRTWAAATVPADWQWGPQTQNPRYLETATAPVPICDVGPVAVHTS